MDDLVTASLLKETTEKDTIITIHLYSLIEHLDILRNKEAAAEEKLTWADLQEMKYTWQVAQELMRMIPPIFGTFRKAMKDTNFGGYDIPKGWQSSKSIPLYAYIPFEAGTHSCIGNEFTRIEALTIVHKLVTKFEWSQVHPDETITQEEAMPFPSIGLPIKVWPWIQHEMLSIECCSRSTLSE
ncbi:hypothetical protein RHMOL_Rhmol13G0074900 [Rhododendron molle]|uniref:Uncharacterized protein n=1 Tax=Rhododendron molle TaxID=49168 RepID=A0ACC0L5H7_RHOML|nr:hypothetical protein RHMOL_Rhmol13G0074900 [Rhododendron molle]